MVGFSAGTWDPWQPQELYVPEDLYAKKLMMPCFVFVGGEYAAAAIQALAC